MTNLEKYDNAFIAAFQVEKDQLPGLNYQEIGDKDGSIFRTRMRFTELQDTLTKDPRFLLILRGMLVNMDFIKRFNDGICYIQDNIRLPITLKNADALEHTWKNYIFQKIRREHRGVTS